MAHQHREGRRPRRPAPPRGTRRLFSFWMLCIRKLAQPAFFCSKCIARPQAFYLRIYNRPATPTGPSRVFYFCSERTNASRVTYYMAINYVDEELVNIRAKKNKKKRKKTLYSKTENQYVVRAVSYKKKQSFADVHLQIGNNMRTTYKMAVALVVLAASLRAALAQSEVYSVNVVGFQKASYPVGLDVLANPFQGKLIREVVGNSGKNGTDATTADNVVLYDSAAQSYVTYYLRSHSSIGYPEWRVGAVWATNVYVGAGQGYFYRNRLATVRTNVVAGDVVMADAVTNIIRPGLQLLSYPFTTRVRMSAMNLKSGVHGADATTADNIMLYNFGTSSYVTYYLRSHSSIGYPEWRVGTSWATNVYVEVGQGFWFRSRVGSPYNYIENTPYPDL